VPAGGTATHAFVVTCSPVATRLAFTTTSRSFIVLTLTPWGTLSAEDEGLEM
jgi:hypothetical protein